MMESPQSEARGRYATEGAWSEDPWRGREDFQLLEPYRRDLPSGDEYLIAKVSDLEAQVAALWSRRQAIDDVERGFGTPLLSPGFEEDIAALSKVLGKTFQEAVAALRTGSSRFLASELVTRLRLLLAAGRAELFCPALAETIWSVFARHLLLLEVRTVEPIFSLVAELNRLLEHMAPLRGSLEEALVHDRVDLAFDTQDSLTVAEGLFFRRYEEAVVGIRTFDPHERRELTEARIQLLVMGKLARRRLRMFALDGLLARLEEVSTPARTWPFLTRFSEPVSRADPFGVSAARAIGALESFIESHALVDDESRERAQRLVARWRSGRVGVLDYREVLSLTGFDERRARLLERGLLGPSGERDAGRCESIRSALRFLRSNLRALPSGDLGGSSDPIGLGAHARGSSLPSASSGASVALRARR